MAEKRLFGTAQRIIETSRAVQEIGLLWGVEDDLQSLRDTVSTIKDVLLDAEEKHAAGDRAVGDWLGKLEDAIYDADDLLDAVSTEALRRQIMTHEKKANQVRIFFSKSNQLAFRLKMAHKIKAIRERLGAIDADRQRFNLELRPAETRVVGKRDNICAEAVIGRDEDKKAVIDRLLDSNVEENVTIHPIVGIGGLGKTTLAQLIFNDDQIQKHFQLKMWVCVSDPFDVQNMVEKIFEAATKRKLEAVDQMETLALNLKEKIDGKKYLLVLDDVWNVDHEKWSRLKVVLMGGARGSRIVVTTRSEMDASITGTVQSYRLEGLDNDASWSVFKQMAFEKGLEPEENSIFVEIGREILANCSGVPLAIRTGVPLAIRTIGSLLRFKTSEEEWLSFKRTELSKISKYDILPTLKLSYDHLPSHLKHCFAYCCLFPKAYQIERSTLIQLWIAQGFVKSSDQNLEDVGNEYFMDLLWRSFFQEAKTDEFGNVIECKMHDLMHDIAIIVAGSMIPTLFDKEKEVDEKTRHVSFGCDKNISFVDPTLLNTASRLRTFLCHSGNYSGNIDCDTIFSSFKFLRVLDMQKRNLDFVPGSIGKLKYLRYLSLSRNYNIKKLPNSITRLLNLQTLRLSYCVSLKKLPRDIKKLVNLKDLELDGCKSLEELPRDIKKLINLRHLEINDCSRLTYMPRGLGQLINLQKLSRFVVHSGHSDIGGLKELNQLNNLRGKLVIENLEHRKGATSRSKHGNLQEKQHLHALHLCWSSRGYVNDSNVANDEVSLEGFQLNSNLKHLRLVRYLGLRLPNWHLSLTNLVRFELFWCKKCQYLPQLSQLRSLRYLVLISLDALEYISDVGDSNEKDLFFLSLMEMKLHDCPKLKGWWRTRDSSVEVNSDSHLLPSFPRLSTLSISFCPVLTSMPMFPHLHEKLVLNHASLKPLQHTMKMNMARPQSPMSTATASSSSTPLSKLKSIQLYSIAGLETLPLQYLTSLESLTISDCPGIQHLIALQHATILQKLEISNFESLTAIPEWIHSCKSLRDLEIRGCLRLASLPEEMHWLSLQRLTIVDCPILLQRCEKDIGEDWAKIVNIPKLHLRYLPQ